MLTNQFKIRQNSRYPVHSSISSWNNLTNSSMPCAEHWQEPAEKPEIDSGRNSGGAISWFKMFKDMFVLGMREANIWTLLSMFWFWIKILQLGCSCNVGASAPRSARRDFEAEPRIFGGIHPKHVRVVFAHSISCKPQFEAAYSWVYD